MVILGDAGINYFGNERDYMLKKRVNKIQISFLCIHGNHEMRPSTIPSYQEQIRFGGKCMYEPEFPDILFAVDGEVYDLAGNKCIAIGGAYSVDKFYRLMVGNRWFPDEQPNEETKRLVEAKLESLENKIDIVMSHTCPLKYVPREMFLPNIDQSTVDTSTEEWLGELESRLDYKKWLCGHYHTDKIDERIRIMFNDFIELGGE